jgi:hypothetical protein
MSNLIISEELKPVVNPSDFTIKNSEEKLTSEPLFGITAQKSHYLKGQQSVIYPHNLMWYDLDVHNKNLFRIHTSENGTMVGVTSSGLYKIEYYTNFWAKEDSDIAIWLIKSPGNYTLRYSVFHLKKGQSLEAGLRRIVRLKEGEKIYIAMRQFKVNGNSRIWIGTSNYEEARSYSGLYIEKL